MADFSVKVQVLSNSQESFSTMSGRLADIADEAKYIISKVGRTAVGDLFDTIQSIKTHSDINNCSTDMRNLADALESIAQLYNRTELCIINKDFTENRVVNFFGIPVKVGTSVMGFVVTDVTSDGRLVLERENHIIEDTYHYFDDYPAIQAAMMIACPSISIFTDGLAKDVKQKIIIDYGCWDSDGEASNISNANGSFDGSAYKFTYITEGEYYKSELEYTVLNVNGEGEISSWDPETILSPTNFLNGEAGAGVGNIKGNVRFGTEEDNFNIGIEIDALSAEANINEGIGGVSYKDAAGERQEGNGVSIGAGASASVVEGTITLQAVNDGKASTVSVSGDYLSAGGGAGLAVTDEGMSANLDIEAIVGVGIAISQEW